MKSRFITGVSFVLWLDNATTHWFIYLSCRTYYAYGQFMIAPWTDSLFLWEQFDKINDSHK